MTEEEAGALARDITDALERRPKAIPLPGEEDYRRLAAALVAEGWSPPGQGKRDHQRKAAEGRGRRIRNAGTRTMIRVLSVYAALPKKLQDKNDGPREVPIHSALAGTVLRLARGRAGDALLIRDGADFGRTPSLTERRFDACRAAVGVVGPSLSIHGLRRWFVRTALDAEQPPDVVAAVVGHFRPPLDAQPKPNWGQRCACVEAVQLPLAAL